MSQFEFMRSIPIGQYLPVASPIHRLDPRARILGFLMLFVAVTATPNLVGLGCGIFLILVGLVVARIPLRYALRGLLPPLPFLLIIAILQVFFNPLSDEPPLLFTLGKLAISYADLRIGFIFLVRFLVLVLTISFSSFCISVSEITRGLEALLQPLARLGLPTRDVVLMVQVTLRFIPSLALSAERIAKAQAARGAEWGTWQGGVIRRARLVIPLIVPLFITSLRRAENLALAMDSRGYGSTGHHTSMVELKFRWQDGLTIGLAALSSACILCL